MRPHLPIKGDYPVLNGVHIDDDWLRYHWFDGVAPYHTGFRPDNSEYEAELVSAVRDVVDEGDSVTIVGGGLGVSTVVAANLAGETGNIVVYEASERRFNTITRTISANDVATKPVINHAIIGEAISVEGDSNRASLIPPSELRDCDVLELDCEGAELDILRNLTISPRAIIVETHANHGVSEEAVREEFDRLGYAVINREVEVSSRGIFVLTAIRD